MSSMAPTILTRSGRYFDFSALDNGQIAIEDIAHALSHICRFTGHTRFFYSVAQHSVLVSRLVPPELAFEALMHDAHEAYVGDMASPLKALVPEFKRVERTVECLVRLRFGLPLVMSPEVKHADLVALRTEQRDCMGSNHVWTVLEGIEPHHEAIEWMPPSLVRELFMRRFRELTDGAPQGVPG